MFDFSKANYDDLCSFLLDVDFSVCFQSNNIYFIWFTFIYEAMSLFNPKIRLKRRYGPEWFNSDIRHHLKCLEKEIKIVSDIESCLCKGRWPKQE